MTLYERIKEELEGMSNADIITVFNEYCDSANRPDNHIYMKCGNLMKYFRVIYRWI